MCVFIILLEDTYTNILSRAEETRFATLLGDLKKKLVFSQFEFESVIDTIRDHVGEVCLYRGGVSVPGRCVCTREVCLYRGGVSVPGRCVYTGEVCLYRGVCLYQGGVSVPGRCVYTGEVCLWYIIYS